MGATHAAAQALKPAGQRPTGPAGGTAARLEQTHPLPRTVQLR